MNKVVLMGRLTRSPEVRYSQGQDGNQTCVARYTLAVDRRVRSQDGQSSADFISCVAFGKSGEFAEKYLSQGTKVAISGRIQTGSYTNKDGQKVYTTDVIVEEQEFAESKAAQGGPGAPQQQPQQRQQPQQQRQGQQQSGGYYGAPAGPGGFIDIPPGFENVLPFR